MTDSKRHMDVISVAREKFKPLCNISFPSTFYELIKQDKLYAESTPPFIRKTKICTGYYQNNSTLTECHKDQVADCCHCPMVAST